MSDDPKTEGPGVQTPPPSETPSAPAAPPTAAPTTPPAAKPKGRPPAAITEEIRQEIIRLHGFYGTREIAPRVGQSRKVVRRVLREEGLVPPPRRARDGSKLDPFRARIESLVKERLTSTRILRELRGLGYDGSRTILARYVRKLRSVLTTLPRRSVKRRFETPPGEEMQIDWSPYLVPIGGRPTRVHALGCLLASCRKLHVRLYRDERTATLLEGLALAFEYFDGVAQRLVLDNMATAVLGRIGPDRKPLWSPRFLDFVRHYGIDPFACRVKDPDRKGKKEKSFRLLFDDFINASRFDSWEELHERLRVWLDETPGVANLRVHGTTRRVPNEAFEDEHPLLIRLPEQRFPVHEEAIRAVDRDSTISVRGTVYTVPAVLANRSVAVRLFTEHFEVLGPGGRIAFSRRYVSDAEKGQLIIDPTHYASLPRGPSGGGGGGAGGGERLDDAFLRRFPALGALVDGLKRRMKTLAPIHLRALLRLCDRYGEEAFLAAASRAQQYRRFDAGAVARILEATCPPPDEPPAAPLSGRGAAVLGEVEPGSLDAYGGLDGAAPTPPSPEGGTQTIPAAGEKQEDDDHGA